MDPVAARAGWLCAKEGRGRECQANRTQVGEWEKFVLDGPPGLPLTDLDAVGVDPVAPTHLCGEEPLP